MDKNDRKFYAMWGLAIILIGITAAIAMIGYGNLAWLVLFGGIGVGLIITSGEDSMKFYGGVGFILLGILIYTALANLNVIWAIIVIVIIIGGLIAWQGLGR